MTNFELFHWPTEEVFQGDLQVRESGRFISRLVNNGRAVTEDCNLVIVRKKSGGYSPEKQSFQFGKSYFRGVFHRM